MVRATAALLWLTLAGLPAQGMAGTTRTIDGRVFEGQLSATADRAIVLVAGQEVALELEQLHAFERRGAAARRVAAPHAVWLRSGLELPATRISGVPAAAGTPAQIAIELPAGIDLALPLASVRALLQGGTTRPEPALFRRDLAQPPPNDDVLYAVRAATRQRSLVTVVGFDGQRVEFLLRGEPFDFEWSGVAAIVFGANTGIAPDRQPRPRALIELVTGERFEGRLLGIGDQLSCRLDEGVEVNVPAAALLRFELQSDRLVWLTELTPRVEQTPAFDRIWPWTIDRTIAGPGFRLAGQEFSRGIGMVPRTRLTFDLGGRFDVFEATAGIDDRGGPDADALLRVLVDGRVAFASEPKTLGAAPDVLRLEIRGARELALEADFGKNYDLGDLCAFADARLLQQ